MTRLQALEGKAVDARYELERAIQEMNKAKRDAPNPPVPYSPSGPMIEIGGRSCYQSDHQTVLRLRTENVGKCRQVSRELNAQIAKAKRGNKP
jgi:hypothetical protein